jgi:hypothetical protein
MSPGGSQRHSAQTGYDALGLPSHEAHSLEGRGEGSPSTPARPRRASLTPKDESDNIHYGNRPP